MSSWPVFSPIESLKALLDYHKMTTRVVMSEAAWDAVKQEAFGNPVSPVQIMDIQGAERSFNGVAVMLHNEGRMKLA